MAELINVIRKSVEINWKDLAEKIKSDILPVTVGDGR